MKSTLDQIPAVLAALYGGLIIGALYDVFALMRAPFKNKWADGVLDGLFYVAAGVLSAIIMLMTTDGRVRLYVILAILFGVFLYLKSLGALFRRAAKFVKSRAAQKKAIQKQDKQANVQNL